MKFTLQAATVAVVSIGALTGCSAPAASPATASPVETAAASPSAAASTDAVAAELSESTAAPAATETYSDIDSLHDAFVAAGGTCKDFFKPQLVQALPTDTGICGDGDNRAEMYLFSSEADRDQLIESDRAMSPVAHLPIHMIVGDLWVIDSPQAAKLADSLGGTLVNK